MTSSILGYLASYRLMIFLSGIISLVLGYRLLMAGLTSDTRKSRDESISAKWGKASVTAKNLAAGTLFALFGLGMLASIALYQPPAIVFETATTGGSQRIEFRGDSNGGPRKDQVAEAIQRVHNNDLSKALDAANAVIRTLARDLNDLSWVLVKANGDKNTAVGLARAAVMAEPNNANYLHTLALALVPIGGKEEALSTMRRAAALDKKYQADLEALLTK